MFTKSDKKRVCWAVYKAKLRWLKNLEKLKQKNLVFTINFIEIIETERTKAEYKGMRKLVNTLGLEDDWLIYEEEADLKRDIDTNKTDIRKQ